MPLRWLRGLGSAKPDRRRGERIARYLDCTWLGAWGEERARVSSLSITGCYIESRFSVPAEGAVVRELTLTMPTGTLNLQGTVIDATRGIGFAVRFTELDENTRDRLRALVQDAQR